MHMHAREFVTMFLGTIPWLMQLYELWGWSPSKHYQFDSKSRSDFFNMFLFGKPVCSHKISKYLGTIVGILVTCIVLFSAIGDALDFDKDGFFSYHGKSQYLIIILMIGFEIQSIMLIIGGINFNQVRNVRDQNIKPKQ